jgi:hypothetical protein
VDFEEESRVYFVVVISIHFEEVQPVNFEQVLPADFEEAIQAMLAVEPGEEPPDSEQALWE